MSIPDIDLPSNRKFGFLFAVIFLVAAAYLYHWGSHMLCLTSGVISVVLIITTLANPDVLLPVNKLWMRLGLLLGMVVSPLVMGLIFFGIFTPVAILMRIFGRDELRLRLKPESSYWVKNNSKTEAESFTQQF